MERRVLFALLVVTVVLFSSVAAGVVLLNKGSADPPHPAAGRTARAWVDLTSLSAGEVREQDRWGSVETFKDAPLGTLHYYHQVSLAQNPNTESVVLDGEVWCMIRANVSNAVLLRYTPEIKAPSWNISLECYAPQGTDRFDPAYGVQQIGLTVTLLDAHGKALGSVDLSYGNPGNGYVRVRDIGGATSHVLSDGLLPAYQYRNHAEGGGPARYIVSFQHIEGSGYCLVTVMHTSGAMVGQVSIDIPSTWSGARQLVLSTTSSVTMRYGVDPNVPNSPVVYVGAWIVDNLACRGATARYPQAGPLYQYAHENGHAPGPNSTWSSGQSGAVVTIDGRPAALNASTGRYEADLPLDVQWSKKVGYSVSLDGVSVQDRMYLTMVSSAPRASVAGWWNGWDWVSVFGLDDCAGPGSVISKYAGYDHPLTAYCMNPGGSSQMTLTYPYAEIALHHPHDWEFGNRKFWNDAVAQAASGMHFLRSNYEYASRWDAPANGGKGDTYISMANPGNKASYQLIFALNGAGIRIDGRTSDTSAGAPGNHSQLGSWYYPGGYMRTGSGWYPYLPIALMDADRGLSWDHHRSADSVFSKLDSIAQNNGVIRVYGHPGRPIAFPDILRWIDDVKANYSLENWKATDGEVASYMYGRWSTDVRFEPARSGNDTWSYIISTKNPQAAGYWKVPVTVAVDLGGRTVKDIVVQEGGKTLRMSDGTLKDLAGKRIMDTGFDLRDGKLYVSHRWNGGSILTVIFEPDTASLLPSADMSSERIMREP